MNGTMTNDPDLDDAILEFRDAAPKLRRLDRQMLTAAKDNYRNYAAIKFERGDLWGTLIAKAEKLQIIPDDHRLGAKALLLVAEVATALQRRTHRKPTPAMVKAMVRDIGELAENDLIEAEADKVETEHAIRMHARKVAAVHGITRYIELSEAPEA